MKSSWFVPPVNFERDIKINLAIWSLSDEFNVPEVIIENYLALPEGAEKEELLTYMKTYMKTYMRKCKENHEK